MMYLRGTYVRTGIFCAEAGERNIPINILSLSGNTAMGYTLLGAGKFISGGFTIRYTRGTALAGWATVTYTGLTKSARATALYRWSLWVCG